MFVMFVRRALPPALLFAVAGVSPMAVAFDAAAYHDATCTRCHGSEVYTRDDRRVTSYPALEAQVARCDANLGTKLFPDDLALLVDYMNSAYYRFEK